MSGTTSYRAESQLLSMSGKVFGSSLREGSFPNRPVKVLTGVARAQSPVARASIFKPAVSTDSAFFDLIVMTIGFRLLLAERQRHLFFR